MKHTSTILTILGAGGTIATAVLAVKETPKVLDLLEEAKEFKGEELTKKEIVKLAAPSYIPAAITCLATLACIFGANIVNKRTQASLLSAYALLDRLHKEYQGKVKEISNEIDIQAKQEIVKDRYDEDISIDPDKKLYCDFHSLRYFESTDDVVEKAEREINDRLKKRGYVLLNEYYELLGIPIIDSGNDMRWSISDGYSKVDFGHDIITINDDFDCCVIYFDNDPTVGYPL